MPTSTLQGGQTPEGVSDAHVRHCEHLHSHLLYIGALISGSSVRCAGALPIDAPGLSQEAMQACGPPPAGCTSPTCALPNAPPHTRSQQPHTEHPRRSRSRLGRAPHCTRRADRARSHGSALQPTYRPPRELSGPDSGRRRRGRSSGGTRGSWKRLVSRARPTKGRLTCGRAQGSNCPFRPERFNDLESRTPCGGDRSRR